MNKRTLVSPFLFAIGCALTMPVLAAQSAESKVEAQQSTEDMSPQGRYKIARKEASAAYKQALSDCQKMKKSERAACTKEAKSNYQSDLAEAKKTFGGAK